MEQVMVVRSGLIAAQFGTDANRLIITSEQHFLSVVQANCTYLGRDMAENDPSWKQIISYCAIVSGQRIFMTRRTKKQTEARLHDRLSVGIGGHVAADDTVTEDVVAHGVRRELLEEVSILSPYTMQYLGVINDNSTEVGKVHAGICYLVRVQEGDCAVKETEKMVGQWVDFADIDQYYPYMEEWSKIVLNTLSENAALLNT